MFLIRKTTAYFLLALLISATSNADINAPEVQQALHDSVSPEDGFASDHVFTCQDRSIVRCDIDDNIIYLRQYIVDETQFDADFSVFAHLDSYIVLAETNLTKLPASLSNVPTLGTVTIIANGFTVPVIDGDDFPENLGALTIEAQQNSVSLINWETQNLRLLTVSALEVNFNNAAIASLTHLNLGNTGSLVNEDFSGFTQVANFSWQQAFENDKTAYYAARAAFPLLSSEMVDLDLSRGYRESKLTEIPSYVLTIPNLRSLKITSHAITQLPPELFTIATLKQLDVSHNDITVLPVIAANNHLESLALAGNNIEQVTSNVLNLHQLQYLDLSHNKFTSLGQTLFSMDNLLTLDIKGNQIVEVVPVSAASTLQSLELSNNSLTQIPAELLQLNNLQSLILSANDLTSLPENIANNASLKILQLDNNKLTSLPVAVFNALSLQNLVARHNQISALPVGVVNSSLEEMNLSSNLFVEAPAELAAFTGLKVADFSNNRIDILGQQWKQSTSLEQLLLGSNQFKALTADMLNNLPASLTLLSLSKNRLVGELPAFAKVNPNLSVNIYGNALWSIDSNILRLYGDSKVLDGQLLPVRGIRVIEKIVDDQLVSYIQWGFPLMQDVEDKTKGTLADKYIGLQGPEAINPGPYVSTGYKLVIDYTQGKNAGKSTTKNFNCIWLVPALPGFCDMDDFYASYDKDTYDSSVFSYGVKGSLAGAKITISNTFDFLTSSPTYWGTTQKHEQFVDEIKYDEATLPPPDLKAGSIYFYHLLVLLVIGFIRIRFTK